jgi:ArsR family transcriptional regulator, virulence genes transcriptional regulator
MAAEVASREQRDRGMSTMAAIREHAHEAAAFLKALANDQRLLVLCSLLERSLSVGEINERVPLSQSALSQHLGVLREAGLVTTARQSQTIYYALAKGPALQIMEVLYSAFCAPTAKKKKSRADG